ncbi:MAG: TonB-dependent receptor plug domain-containing protein [Flavobacteriales bacterium]
MEKIIKSTLFIMTPSTLYNAQRKFLFLFILFAQSIRLFAQDPHIGDPRIRIDSVLAKIPSRVMTVHQIELIAGRNGGSYATRMQSIEKLNQATLNNLPARSIADALSFSAGVDVRQRGLNGTQADIGIRGGNFEQSLLLVNGFKMTDPQTGHHAANLPIPLIAVSEIQVFKSPTVLQFGQSALTGAVHIGAYAQSGFEVKTMAYGGGFNSFGAQALVCMKIKNYQQMLAVARDQSEGHWYNSDFKNHQFFYTGGHAVGQNQRHHLNYIAAFADRNFGANGFYSNKFPEQWEHTTMAAGGIKHNFNRYSRKEGSTKWYQFRQQVLFRRHADEFRLKRYDPSFYTNTHVSDVLSYEAQFSYHVRSQQVFIGVEQRFEKLNSSNLGLRERQYQSAFVQAQGMLGTLNYAAGLLAFTYNWQNPQLMPSVQLGRALSYQHYLFANYARGNRVPSWTEMYYSDPSNVGNPNLQPEFSHAAELGYRYNPNQYNSKWYYMKAEAAIFYRQHTNMIDWVRETSLLSPNPNPWMPVNINSVAFAGLEGSWQFNVKKSGTWGLNKFNLNYTYITAQHNFTMEQESRYAITSMRHQFNALVLFDLSEKAQLNLAYRLVQRIEQPLYQVLDAKLVLPVFDRFSFFVEGNNLTNTQYVEAGFVQMPGRWFKLGVSFQHKAKENPQP